MSDELADKLDEISEQVNELVVLNAQQFLELADALNTEFVDFAEVGRAGGVWIRELTAGQRDRIQKMGGKIRINKDESQDFDLSSLPAGGSAKIVRMGVVTDESGQQSMFNAKDERALNAMPTVIIDLLVKRIRKLSGMNREAQEEAKKNLTTTPNGSSGTS
jgi:hypothetical protein